MIYFDHAATSGFHPQIVIDTVTDVLKNLCANPGRGGHRKAVEATMRIFRTRSTVKQFVNASSEDCVVFTQNCTAALNLAILGSVRKGGHVIVGCTEHNSVLRPLHELRERGFLSLTVLPPDETGRISPQAVENAITSETYLVALSHVSNVTGAVNDLEAVGEVCKRYRLLFLADAAQSAGYLPLDMQKTGLSYLAFSGHKGLHGPQGTGVLCFSPDAQPNPVVFGGTGTQSHLLTQPTEAPECFESGTLNTAGIAGLNEAIRWTVRNHRVLQTKQDKLQSMLYRGLEQIKNCKLYSVPTSPGGIVTFALPLPSAEVADLLNERDVAVRGGLHCAPLIHRHLGTFETGLVRASVSGLNTEREVLFFLQTIDQIANGSH